MPKPLILKTLAVPLLLLSGLTRADTLTLPEAAALALPGCSNFFIQDVYVNDSTAIVPCESDTSPQGAAVQFYSASMLGWTLAQTVDLPAEASAFSVDGDTAVIGQPGFSDTFIIAGQVSIFERDANGVWISHSTIFPRLYWEFFGQSVAVLGDTLAIGSNPGGETSAPGKIHIYARTGNEWQPTQVLETGNHSSDDFARRIEMTDDTLATFCRSYANCSPQGVRLYRKQQDGLWQYSESIPADDFSLDESTLVTHSYNYQADTSTVSFYELDNDRWTHQQTIALNTAVNQIALDGDTAVISRNENEHSENAYIYQRQNQASQSQENWVLATQVQTARSDYPAGRTFINSLDLSNDNLVLSTNFYPSDNSQRSTFTYFLDLSSALLNLDSTNTANTSTAVQAVDCVDHDGDGWGWNGTATCVPQQTQTCIDTDGDGWGWDGRSSCLVSRSETADESVFNSVPCIDTDGDGWGWQQPAERPDLGRSCRP